MKQPLTAEESEKQFCKELFNMKEGSEFTLTVYDKPTLRKLMDFHAKAYAKELIEKDIERWHEVGCEIPIVGNEIDVLQQLLKTIEQ